MKILFKCCLVAAMALFTTTAVVAQPAPAPQPVAKVAMTTTTFQTDIKTPQEAGKIKAEISKLHGVVDFDFDAKSKVVTVKYEDKKCSDPALLKEFQKHKVAAKVIPHKK